MSNCSVSRNIMELGVIQVAVLVLFARKKVLETEMEFKCEKSIEIPWSFSFFLVLVSITPLHI